MCQGESSEWLGCPAERVLPFVRRAVLLPSYVIGHGVHAGTRQSYRHALLATPVKGCRCRILAAMLHIHCNYGVVVTIRTWGRDVSQATCMGPPAASTVSHLIKDDALQVGDRSWCGNSGSDSFLPQSYLIALCTPLSLNFQLTHQCPSLFACAGIVFVIRK